MSKLYRYSARCSRVVDGDTLDLDIDLGFGMHFFERVRLFGIDTPETFGVKKDSDEYARGKAAADRVRELVEDEVLLIQTVDTSRRFRSATPGSTSMQS